MLCNTFMHRVAASLRGAELAAAFLIKIKVVKGAIYCLKHSNLTSGLLRPIVLVQNDHVIVLETVQKSVD